MFVSCFEDEMNKFGLQFFGYSVTTQNPKEWFTEVQLKAPYQKYLKTKTHILTLEPAAVGVE